MSKRAPKSERIAEIDAAFAEHSAGLPTVTLDRGRNWLTISAHLPTGTMSAYLREAGVIADDPEAEGEPGKVLLYWMSETQTTGGSEATIQGFDDRSVPRLAARLAIAAEATIAS